MKNLLLSLCLILAVCTKVSAQNTFAPLGAEWWYHGNNVNYTYGPLDMLVNETWIDHLRVTGDTMILGVNCRKAVATRTKKNGRNPDSSFVDDSKILYFYDNTDTVFYFNERDNSFDALYVLNAAEGDTICLKNPYYPLGPAGTKTTFCFIVDSIRMVLFDTTSLKTFYTRTLFDSTDFFIINWGKASYSGGTGRWSSSGQYTERLGGTYERISGIFPAFTFRNADGGIDITFPSGYLNCYSDPYTTIKRTVLPCDSVNTPHSAIVSVSLGALGVTVYPNPSAGTLTILSEKPFEKAVQLQVIDISGRIWAEEQIPKGRRETRLLLGNLNSGMYYLRLSTAKGKYYQKIILQP